MVWPQGGLNGLAWDGKDRCINLMPRSLRWHSVWHTYRYHLYGISFIYAIVGLVSLYSCWLSYDAYEKVKIDFLQLQANVQYQSIHQRYGELMAIKNKIVQTKSPKNQSNIYSNTMVLYILDTAMAEHISLQHLSVKDRHISIDGIGVSDDKCRKFIAILQQKLVGMECHGTVKADKGVYTFHMDGYKREHNVSGESHTDSPGGVGNGN